MELTAVIQDKIVVSPAEPREQRESTETWSIVSSLIDDICGERARSKSKGVSVTKVHSVATENPHRNHGRKDGVGSFGIVGGHVERRNVPADSAKRLTRPVAARP